LGASLSAERLWYRSAGCERCGLISRLRDFADGGCCVLLDRSLRLHVALRFPNTPADGLGQRLNTFVPNQVHPARLAIPRDSRLPRHGEVVPFRWNMERPPNRLAPVAKRAGCAGYRTLRFGAVR